MDTTTITPRVGVGDLRLAAPPDEVLRLLSRPDETVNEDDTASWYYDALDLSLGFEQFGDTWRLTSIDVSGRDVRLGDDRPIGATREDVAAMAERAGLRDGHWRGDTEQSGWLEFDDAGLEFWFDEGKLEEITVAVPESERPDESVLAAHRRQLPPPLVVEGAVSPEELAASLPRRRMPNRVAMTLLVAMTLFLGLAALGGIGEVLAGRRAPFVSIVCAFAAIVLAFAARRLVRR